MYKNDQNQQKIYDAEVVDSSVINESELRKVLIKAGRAIAKPALEAFEMLLDPLTPTQARISLIAALTYFIMPIDLVPDFVPMAGFSDDLVALTAVISLWSNHITPEIRNRAQNKLDKWLPL